MSKKTPGQRAAQKAWVTRRKNEAAAKAAAMSPAHKAWVTRRKNEAAAKAAAEAAAEATIFLDTRSTREKK